MNKSAQLLPFFLWLMCSSQLHAQNFDIYVSDAANYSNPPWQILKYDQNGQNAQVFISDSLAWPQDIVFIEGSNEVLISNLNSGKINTHDATTGDFISVFADSIGGPTRMKIGPDGYLYVLQWAGNGKVLRYDLNNGFVDEFTSTGVVKSIGLDWDQSGNLYVSSFSGDLVQKFDINGVDQGVFINTNLVGPTNIWFDDNGDLLVSDYLGGAVKRYDNTGSFLGDFISGLNQPEGIDTLINGDLLIGNGGTAAVKRYDSDGNFIEDIIPAGAGGLQTPNAVVVRYDSTLAIHEETEGLEIEVKSIKPDSFWISLANTSDRAHFMIYQLDGSVVFEENEVHEITWDATKVKSGVYLLKVTLGQQASSKKIIVKHE